MEETGVAADEGLCSLIIKNNKNFNFLKFFNKGEMKMKKSLMRRNLLKRLLLGALVSISLLVVCGGCCHGGHGGGGHHGRC